jgi:hypothetical protein
MAKIRRPSFLKKQKEQKRVARAAKKREEQQARRQAQREIAATPETPESIEGESPTPSESDTTGVS